MHQFILNLSQALFGSNVQAFKWLKIDVLAVIIDNQWSIKSVLLQRLSINMAKSAQREFELSENTFGNFSKMLPLHITHILKHSSTFIPETS